jgi:HNH endonuclease
MLNSGMATPGRRNVKILYKREDELRLTEVESMRALLQELSRWEKVTNRSRAKRFERSVHRVNVCTYVQGTVEVAQPLDEAKLDILNAKHSDPPLYPKVLGWQWFYLIDTLPLDMDGTPLLKTIWEREPESARRYLGLRKPVYTFIAPCPDRPIIQCLGLVCEHTLPQGVPHAGKHPLLIVFPTPETVITFRWDDQNPRTGKPIFFPRYPFTRLPEQWPTTIPEDNSMSMEEIIDDLNNQMQQDSFFSPANLEEARQRIAEAINYRRGQTEFRDKLIEIYGGKCTITGCDAKEALEAAHIIPYRLDQNNDPENGLLLRADIHTLFDLGLLAINDSDMSVILSKELNGTVYENLHGRRLRLPRRHKNVPNKSFLAENRKMFFRDSL